MWAEECRGGEEGESEYSYFFQKNMGAAMKDRAIVTGHLRSREGLVISGVSQVNVLGRQHKQTGRN